MVLNVQINTDEIDLSEWKQLMVQEKGGLMKKNYGKGQRIWDVKHMKERALSAGS